MDQPFSLLLKPASADCNLCCDYCFYLDKKALYPDQKTHRMSDKTLTQVIKSYFATSQPVYTMTWQGGEPALMGEPFYQKVIALQKHFAAQGSRIMNALQTNATCVSDKLASLMGKYRFLAGCSLDGPADIHNVFRRDCLGKPTHNRVITGISRLAGHGVPVNVLCMVTSANVNDPDKVYAYFKQNGFSFIQFIPCVEQDHRGDLLPWSITGRQWGEFLVHIFKQWYPEDIRTVSIRNFESVLAKLVMGEAAECRMAEQCNQYLVVEHNGDIYPCDFFVEKEYWLGNIHSTSFKTIRESEAYQRFAKKKSRLSSRCRKCEFLSLCMGDCRKFYTHTADQEEISLLCNGWYHFYKTTLADFKEAASAVSKGKI